MRGLMVFETVRRARRRILANEVLRQSAHCFSAALGSFILLLLLGTQILSWPWMVVLPLVTVGTGIFVTWRRMPSPYQVAQRVDQGVGLSDALATALYFSDRPRGSADVLRAQREQANRIARTVDLRRAIPIRFPRALYGTALLGLIASSLFALRYGLDHRLDLHPPLARMLEEKFGFGIEPQVQQARRQTPRTKRDRQEQMGLSLDNPTDQKGPGELDAAPDSALDTVDVPNVDNSKQPGSKQDGARQGKTEQAGEGQTEGQEAEGMNADSGNQQSAEGRKAPGAGKEGQAGEKQPSNSSSDGSNSLLSKFRDAMSNLMSRMRQQSGAPGSQQQASAGQNSQQAKNQAGNRSQNGKQGQQQGNGQQGESQDGEPSEEGQPSQQAQAGSNGQSGQEPATHQPGSGIGRQDGSKDPKLAEQLAAMGKISEIIGKRSATVTGDLTVEVQNTSQTLRTPYAQRTAQHTEAGGEINRDEVPVALQAYVQQYFEEVRKQAPGPAVTPKLDPRTHRRAEPQKTPSF
ncbi:MAG: hypothetical protein U0Q18_29890 [Bryobacteraceae bacterium]